MIDALAAFKVFGVPTTIPFHLDVLRHADFRAARVHTRWVDERSGRAGELSRCDDGARLGARSHA
jgi:biotin carboxylase